MKILREDCSLIKQPVNGGFLKGHKLILDFGKKILTDGNYVDSSGANVGLFNLINISDSSADILRFNYGHIPEDILINGGYFILSEEYFDTKDSKNKFDEEYYSVFNSKGDLVRKLSKKVGNGRVHRIDISGRYILETIEIPSITEYSNGSTKWMAIDTSGKDCDYQYRVIDADTGNIISEYLNDPKISPKLFGKFILDEVTGNMMDLTFKTIESIKVPSSFDLMAFTANQACFIKEYKHKGVYGRRFVSLDGKKKSEVYDKAFSFNEGRSIVIKGTDVKVLDENFNEIGTLLTDFDPDSEENSYVTSVSMKLVGDLSLITLDSKYSNGKYYFDSRIFGSDFKPIVDVSNGISGTTSVNFIKATDKYLTVRPNNSLLDSNRDYLGGNFRELDIKDGYKSLYCKKFDATLCEGISIMDGIVKRISCNDDVDCSITSFYEKDVIFDLSEIGTNLWSLEDKDLNGNVIGSTKYVFPNGPDKIFKEKMMSGKLVLEDFEQNVVKCDDIGDNLVISGKKFNKKLLKIKGF